MGRIKATSPLQSVNKDTQASGCCSLRPGSSYSPVMGLDPAATGIHLREAAARLPVSLPSLPALFSPSLQLEKKEPLSVVSNQAQPPSPPSSTGTADHLTVPPLLVPESPPPIKLGGSVLSVSPT